MIDLITDILLVNLGLGSWFSIVVGVQMRLRRGRP